MKNSLILIFITLFNSISYCQSGNIRIYKNCEIINGDTVNCLTSDNIKDGKWIYYKDGGSSHSDFGKPEDYVKYKEYLYLVSEGQYCNNKKVGLWKFYSDYKTFESQYINHLIYYNPFGTKDSIEIEYSNKDIIRSKIYWKSGKIDSLKVFYDNQILRYLGQYKDGILNKFRIYYPNGKLKYKGSEILDYKVRDLIYLDSCEQKITPKENDIRMIATFENLMNYLVWDPNLSAIFGPSKSHFFWCFEQNRIYNSIELGRMF